MKVVADLHLHSKYSRAVSQQMVPEIMVQWAKKKGIDLLGSADWTHPLWLKELESCLEEVDLGIYNLKTQNSKLKSATQNSPASPRLGRGRAKLKEPNFILSTEISSIYSQGGKTRRIHNLVLAPSFKTVHKINDELKRRGCKLMSDGRPIIGLSSIQLAELIWSIDESVLIVPAHCLLPEEQIHIQGFKLKPIEKIKVGDKVYTHKNRWQKVTEIFKKRYKGKIYHIISDYFHPGIKVTGEHPFYALKTKKRCPSINKDFGVCKPICSHLKKGCARQYFKNYKPEWILAENLELGDILLYPRYKKIIKRKFIDVKKIIGELKGPRLKRIPTKLVISKNFCRLIGYFLAEGYTNGRDNIGFCFNNKEKEYLEDIKEIFRKEFNWSSFREYQRKTGGIELLIDSKELCILFENLFYIPQEKKIAGYKKLPDWVLSIHPKLQKEILIGWWRGDKGYSTSRLLINQFKIICLRLGIIPSIHIDSAEKHLKRGNHFYKERIIKANFDLFSLSNLCFFEDKYKLLNEREFKKFERKINRTRGWLDDDFVYLPVRKILNENFNGYVYNLEVGQDNSYTSEFALVHNCWTPWFSMFGSKSGFDSLKECWGEFADRIYAIETGLSSDPLMNWRIKDLDNRSIVSFGDSHSPAKLGRELTIFELKSLSFSNLSKALVSREQFNNLTMKQLGNYISYTVEFYPEEGKYHYTGHRNCGVKHSPAETKKKGAQCPVCGRLLTLGVMHRVSELASRDEIEPIKKNNENGLTGYYNPLNKTRPPYVMLVPLMEILAEAFNIGVSSIRVKNEYENLTKNLASELEILTQTKLTEIEKLVGAKAAEGVEKVRKGDIVIDPGYDGVFGTVKIWKDGEKLKSALEKKQGEQASLF